MDLLAVAAVRAAHGVAGELRVRSLSGETAHLLRLRAVFLRRGNEERVAEVVAARPAASAEVLMRLAGVGTREQAQALAGWEIWAERDQAAPLGAGEYYAADVCRCGVFLDGRRRGAVRGVCDLGGRQYLDVLTEEGRRVLVPFADRFVGEVDVAAGRIELRGEEVLE
jgi:16S rRNA processing protein RimM